MNLIIGNSLIGTELMPNERIPRTLWQILKTDSFYKISHDFPAVEQMMKGFLIWTILLVSPLVSTVKSPLV